MSVDVRSSSLGSSSTSISRSNRSCGAAGSPRGRCGIRKVSFCCSPTCPRAPAVAGTNPEGYRRLVARPTNKANGLTFDGDGHLVVCEHESSVVSVMDGGGTGTGRRVVASHFDGRQINSPNDVVVHSDGSIYFTDPLSGRDDPDHGFPRESDLGFRGVFASPRAGATCSSSQTTSTPPTGCASRRTSRCSTSSTPFAATSASLTCSRMAGSRTDACSRSTLESGTASGDQRRAALSTA